MTPWNLRRRAAGIARGLSILAGLAVLVPLLVVEGIVEAWRGRRP